MLKFDIFNLLKGQDIKVLRKECFSERHSTFISKEENPTKEAVDILRQI